MQHTAHTQKLSFYFFLIHRQCLRWYDRPDWMQSLKSGLLINAENMENKWYCMQKSWPRSRVVNENIHTIGLYCLLIICSFATQSINCNVENKKKKSLFFLCPSKNHNPSFLWRDYDLCWSFQFYHLMEIVYTNCMYTTSKLCFNTYSVFSTKIKKGWLYIRYDCLLQKTKTNEWRKQYI